MERKLFRKRDIVLLLVILAVSAFFFFITSRDSGEGAEIWLDGKLYREFPLDTRFELTLDNGVTIVGDGESAWFSHSDCRDKVCVNTGRLSLSGQWAACLPNGTVLKITKGNGDVDTVS